MLLILRGVPNCGNNQTHRKLVDHNHWDEIVALRGRCSFYWHEIYLASANLTHGKEDLHRKPTKPIPWISRKAYTIIKNCSLSRIWGSHSGSYDECCHILRFSPHVNRRFGGLLSPPSSGSKISRAGNQRAAGGYADAYGLHGTISQKMPTFKQFVTFLQAWQFPNKFRFTVTGDTD
jgi:hypothetical protein